MIIGIDFDNTIVGYDEVFHAEALRQGLIPAEAPVSKNGVRDYLRKSNREAEWTRLQGRVYGACMGGAAPFPGVIDFFKHCHAEGIMTFIISHKTRTPYEGEDYDLHKAAGEWLALNGFFVPATGLTEDRVFWELTRQEKLARIRVAACTLFIDDLPEIFSDASFPEGVERVLFDPNHAWSEERRFSRLTHWTEMPARLSRSKT